MPEHVHGCLACRPDMVPAFDRADPRYHDGPKCGTSRFGAVLLDGADAGYTQGAFEGPEGWLLSASPTRNVSHVHHCSCGARNVCLEPRFGVVTVEHLPPVMIDADEVIRHLPHGWPGPEASPEIRAQFSEGWEPFFRWLHERARG